MTNHYISVPDNSSNASGDLPRETTTVYLLVDADGDFSAGATEIAMTLSGTERVATTDLDDGQFFTFATHIPKAPG